MIPDDKFPWRQTSCSLVVALQNGGGGTKFEIRVFLSLKQNYEAVTLDRKSAVEY